jgi:hypothetical protein
MKRATSKPVLPPNRELQAWETWDERPLSKYERRTMMRAVVLLVFILAMFGFMVGSIIRLFTQ